MEKRNKIILIGVILLTVIVLIICGYLLLNRNKFLKDSELFRNEYMRYNDKMNNNGSLYPKVEIAKDNNIQYLTEEEAVKLLTDGTGVIYFGFETCPWCRTLVTPLLEVAKEKNEVIYYLNIKNIRSSYEIRNDELVKVKDGSVNYYKLLDLLVEELDEYYLTDENYNDYDTHEKRILAPTLVAVKNGKVTSIHVGTVETQESGYDSLNKEQINELKTIISNLIASKNDSCSINNC